MMKKVRLPNKLDPVRVAQQRSDYHGIYTPAQMPRLAAFVQKIDEDICCSLSFFIDEQGLTVFKGTAETVVTLICERCVNPFSKRLNVSYQFSPVSGQQQITVLPEIYEPVDFDAFGEIDLLSAIEDELILALPTVPVHDLAQCAVTDLDRAFGELPAQTEKQNPFAILARLRRH